MRAIFRERGFVQKRITFWFMILVLVVTLGSCEKPKDITNTIKQTPIEIELQTGPEIGPGTGGFEPLPEGEYEKIPGYRVDPREGRLSADPVDLSKDMPLPDRQGQGAENSCVGWATGYAVRSYLHHIDRGTTYYPTPGIRDDKTVFSPRFIYNSLIQKTGPPAKDIPTRIPDALNLLLNVGVCTWADMPYIQGQFTQPTNTLQTQSASNYKIKFWFPINPINRNLFVEDIKRFLKTRNVPVIIGIKTDDGFQNPKGSIGNGYEMIGREIVWRSFIKKVPPTGTEEKTLGHALVVVGYDDNKNAFKLMNSYGNGWANSGFIWMDYNLFKTDITLNGKAKKIVDEAYVVISSLKGLVPIQTTESWTYQMTCSNDYDGSEAITFEKVKLPVTSDDAPFKIELTDGFQTFSSSHYRGTLEGTFNSSTRMLKAQFTDDSNVRTDKFELILPLNNEFTDWVNAETVSVEDGYCPKGMVRFKRE